MKKSILFLFTALLILNGLAAQEINSKVTVSAEQTGKTQLSVFNTMERSVQEFINQTSWTSNDLENFQKINCSVFINVTSYNSDQFKATIQIQSSRPVFGSTYVSPILNFKDNQFDFSYTEYQPLDYNRNTYKSNLVSTISFYVYTILGLDADTFSPEGGTNYYEEAQQIVNTAQQGNAAGWRATDGSQSRYRLNADLLSNSFNGFREALYTYHREGLDVMHADPEAGKKKIVESIQTLREVNNTRPNSILIRSFFDAKSDEVENILSGGPKTSITEVVDNLNSIAPLYSKQWRNISY